tara:strand:+ start:2345 stop:3511 length:1167 start_codon:yes stop_codon:yes gene_type:complete
MKKKIAILGSTGSIGKALLEILSKNKKTFDIYLLTINKNYKDLIDQTRKFNVKNVIINDELSYKNFKKLNKNKKINIFNNFNSFDKIFSTKIDYVMSSIVGIAGLFPTIEIIKYTKNIAIANKESIICAWNLISKELQNNNTNFLPVDSEHFSIWYGIKNNSISNISKIYLTASGGPLLKIPKKKYKFLNISKITKHPNWSMGKKISVDSSTMMNKVFEVIEAKKMFDISYDQISIMIHPKSYVHAIIAFDDGMIKILSHETTMKIPIANTLKSVIKTINLDNKNSSKLNLNNLNNLELSEVKVNKFPFTKILNTLPKKDSLFETVLVAANDEFVSLFLKEKISYTEFLKKLVKFVKKKEFTKYKRIEPRNITDIIKLNQKIRSKINS